MNKTTRLFVRVSETEKRRLQKAGKTHHGLSAFLLRSVELSIKYRRLIDQAESLSANNKIANMKVSAT